MSQTDWSRIRHFESWEFDSPDLPGSGEMMQREIVEALDNIRERCGFPFVVTSGFRTAHYNEQIAGVEGSAHTSGFAADIACRTSRNRQLVLRYALDLGFQRIGVAKSFIHLDCHPFLPKPVLWLYD